MELLKAFWPKRRERVTIAVITQIPLKEEKSEKISELEVGRRSKAYQQVIKAKGHFDESGIKRLIVGLGDKGNLRFLIGPFQENLEGIKSEDYLGGEQYVYEAVSVDLPYHDGFRLKVFSSITTTSDGEIMFNGGVKGGTKGSSSVPRKIWEEKDKGALALIKALGEAYIYPQRMIYKPSQSSLQAVK